MRRRTRRSNPGVAGIVMNGLYIGLGMWAGGMIGGVIGSFTGGLTSSLGPLGGIAQGFLTAYAVSWIGDRTIGHGDMMGAGAFAGTAVNAISGLLGQATSLVSSATSQLTSGAKQ